MLFSGAGSYYDSYARKNDTTRTLNDPPSLLTDRGAYVNYLEVQLERISAALLGVQAYDQRFCDMQSLIVSLEQRCMSTTKLVALSQQCTEELKVSVEQKFKDIEEQMRQERMEAMQNINHVASRVTTLEATFAQLPIIVHRLDTLDKQLLDEQRATADRFAAFDARSHEMAMEIAALQKTHAEALNSIEKLFTTTSKQDFEMEEMSRVTKNHIHATESTLRANLEDANENFNRQLHSLSSRITSETERLQVDVVARESGCLSALRLQNESLREEISRSVSSMRDQDERLEQKVIADMATETQRVQSLLDERIDKLHSHLEQQHAEFQQQLANSNSCIEQMDKSIDHLTTEQEDLYRVTFNINQAIEKSMVRPPGSMSARSLQSFGSPRSRNEYDEDRFESQATQRQSHVEGHQPVASRADEGSYIHTTSAPMQSKQHGDVSQVHSVSRSIDRASINAHSVAQHSQRSYGFHQSSSHAADIDESAAEGKASRGSSQLRADSSLSYTGASLPVRQPSISPTPRASGPSVHYLGGGYYASTSGDVMTEEMVRQRGLPINNAGEFSPSAGYEQSGKFPGASAGAVDAHSVSAVSDVGGSVSSLSPVSQQPDSTRQFLKMKPPRHSESSSGIAARDDVKLRVPHSTTLTDPEIAACDQRRDAPYLQVVRDKGEDQRSLRGGNFQQASRPATAPPTTATSQCLDRKHLSVTIPTSSAPLSMRHQTSDGIISLQSQLSNQPSVTTPQPNQQSSNAMRAFDSQNEMTPQSQEISASQNDMRTTQSDITWSAVKDFYAPDMSHLDHDSDSEDNLFVSSAELSASAGFVPAAKPWIPTRNVSPKRRLADRLSLGDRPSSAGAKSQGSSSEDLVGLEERKSVEFREKLYAEKRHFPQDSHLTGARSQLKEE